MGQPRPPLLVPASGRPLQQGDVFLTAGAVALTHTGSDFTFGFPQQVRVVLAPAQGDAPGLDAVGTRCLVMVVSHDCQLDKELHLAARRLRKENSELTEEAAYARAEDDASLDRNVVVSPVVGLSSISAAGGTVDSSLLSAGRIVGYLPIPMQPPVMPQEAVVELTVRVTVDRLALSSRVASLTDDARIQLRYALARMDSLRIPDIGEELAAAVGSRIKAVHRPDAKRPTVTIELENGQHLELLPRPAAPPPEGAGRTRRP